MKAPLLSIIIPCYNESKNLPQLMTKLKCLDRDGFEIIIVDNGSTDNTSELFHKIINKSKYRYIKIFLFTIISSHWDVFIYLKS